jgi:hypothetical protein
MKTKAFPIPNLDNEIKKQKKGQVQTRIPKKFITKKKKNNAMIRKRTQN